MNTIIAHVLRLLRVYALLSWWTVSLGVFSTTVCGLVVQFKSLPSVFAYMYRVSLCWLQVKRLQGVFCHAPLPDSRLKQGFNLHVDTL